ncbi:hypothetical protein SDC9_171470 [bioreactor metagenome]|uniref:Uncharacterized protein n=1 Tax=bioreactor metagenome TaxID=1076179 RepID=A0A645GD56_9ZZZZ
MVLGSVLARGRFFLLDHRSLDAVTASDQRHGRRAQQTVL